MWHGYGVRMRKNASAVSGRWRLGPGKGILQAEATPRLHKDSTPYQVSLAAGVDVAKDMVEWGMKPPPKFMLHCTAKNNSLFARNPQRGSAVKKEDDGLWLSIANFAARASISSSD
ncbi:hypothetical protein GJ744_001865 [Endocarpon pusillum]|uniref:Uncharacterized protein n=1 Tax=Endocarpon pusillum TaxID=364733 RepID=A0A8H7AQC3_9EURO|nr:hypothetical protein GJ744_001865 [Endocarpon pusillum]